MCNPSWRVSPPPGDDVGEVTSTSTKRSSNSMSGQAAPIPSSPSRHRTSGSSHPGSTKHVRVDQRDVADALEVAQRQVVGREAGVDRVVHEDEVGEARREAVGAAVGRRVVDDDDLEAERQAGRRRGGRRCRVQRLDAAHDVVAAVEVEHHDAHRGRRREVAALATRPAR